jgi:biopolymer transport protein ExbD
VSRKRKEHEVAEVELPITPMLDMAFQLMVFFILTYHPSALEVQIDGTLLPPKVVNTARKDSKSKDDQKVDPSIKKEPENDNSLVVIVEALTEERRKSDLETLKKYRRISEAHYQAGLKNLQEEVAKKKDGKESILGTPYRIFLKTPDNVSDALIVVMGQKLWKDPKDKDSKKAPDAIIGGIEWKDGLRNLESELRTLLLKNLEGENTDVEISTDDGKLYFEYLVRIQDVCKTRYGVVSEGGKEVLKKISSRKKEKDYTKIVGFKNVSYLLPPPEKKTPEDQARERKEAEKGK